MAGTENQRDGMGWDEMGCWRELIGGIDDLEGVKSSVEVRIEMCTVGVMITINLAWLPPPGRSTRRVDEVLDRQYPGRKRLLGSFGWYSICT